MEEQQKQLASLKSEIAALYAQRESLKQTVAMASHIQRPRLWAELEAIDMRLSALDSRYKTLWDAQ